jgi:hypothetical protein
MALSPHFGHHRALAPAPRLWSRPMQLAEGIRRHGFRKWYERQLLQSHAHLTLTFLCLIGLMGAMEAASSFTAWSDRLTDALAVVICAAVGLWALRRYLYLLNHAEYVANQADCPGCGTYARFTLVAEHTSAASVRCRKCGHEWTINA